MLAIPAGIFLMGADALRGNAEEKPAHEAVIAAFFLDKTEVTMSAYARCVAAKACTPPQQTNRFCNAKLQDTDKHPVNCVDLFQADAYCRWAGKRLPSEREWEYAASGGRERRRFSWGEDEPTPALACYDHAGGTCPVASFAPGAFGLFDMTGNVWEWTSSPFVPYPSLDTAPGPIERQKNYVYRGGSWSRRFPKWMRNMNRNRYTPEQQSAAIGIRCAKSIEPLECPPDSEAREGGCRRVRGTPLCEPSYVFRDSKCVVDLEGATAQASPSGADPSQLGVPQAGNNAEAVTEAITRTRTPQHDSDCRRHWPGTPAAYLFKGGKNFPARKPVLQAAGCAPRDMGTSWTSACCPG